jgi:hypothetical protein
MLRYFRAAVLCRVFVEIDLGCARNNFACRVVAARRTNVVGALKLTTIVTLVWVCRDKRVVRTPVVATGFGYFVLLDSHVSTL